MRGIAVQLIFTKRGKMGAPVVIGAVKIFVGQEVFGAAGTHFEKKLLAPGILQIVFSYIFKPSFLPLVCH